MAYSPNDDRFYDALTGAGKDYQKYRDRVAEDQAATTRELGHIYGQALPNTIGAAMKGADWSMKRAADQQKIDNATSEEARAQAEEGRKGTKFGWEGEDRAAQMASAAQAKAYDMAPATEEEASTAGLHFHPGMTHADLKQAAGIQALGKDMRDLEEKKAEEGGRNTRQTAELTSAEKRAADTLAGENARASASQFGENSRLDKKIAADKALEGMKLAAPKPPSTDQLNAANFGTRAGKAMAVIDQLETGDPANGVKPYNVAEHNIRTIKNPVTGSQPFAKPEDRQYQTMQDEFIAAVLRRESGAAISKDEREQYGAMYFPQPGEDTATQELKRQLRHSVAASLNQIAGPAATSQVTGTPVVLAPKHAGGNGVAYGDDNMNLAPADLQGAMVNHANGPKKPAPLHKMTLEEKKAEARARGIPVD
jgi:hypothetical protein